ncbi:hypothetical protein E1B28_001053 [Marasmius oreades]|uniref:GST N-terminal domain-containing protein n=1 Tax=Marasmius oreades TaxID=181124 RepID=A0A9P7V2Q0_9AGAR|nr:uncharacterized protein E1B28_001053 [Marasmius oreades]KAG7099184.1 hypothetical protein E1B28_001053 [Marasmius oreades]
MDFATICSIPKTTVRHILILSLSMSMPKAVLYYDPKSIWSSGALLTLMEKGYGDDELNLKIVDLSRGENYGPSFLRLNSKATVPTLVVPLEKTLSDEVESRYKAITETKGIIEFLDKSRSPLSRTHTTSNAPAPSLTPATIAFSTTSKIIIDDILHSEPANPNNLLFMNARDDLALRELSRAVFPLLKGKHQALSHYLAEAETGKITVTEKIKDFWRNENTEVESLLSVFEKALQSSAEIDEESKIKRAAYFNIARVAWETGMPKILTKLNDEVIGPFALGEQVSIADLHLAPWLAHVAKLAGATTSDDGSSAIEKIEKHVGNGFSLTRVNLPVDLMKLEGARPASRSKLAAFWDVVKERPSWKKIYADGLV